MVIGRYYLVVSPDSDAPQLGRSVVNLLRLTIGEALTLAGAISFAVGWRPRIGLASASANHSSGELTPQRREALLEDIARLEERKDREAIVRW